MKVIRTPLGIQWYVTLKGSIHLYIGWTRETILELISIIIIWFTPPLKHILTALIQEPVSPVLTIAGLEMGISSLSLHSQLDVRATPPD